MPNNMEHENNPSWNLPWVAFLALLVLGCGVVGIDSARADMEIVVPAYFYPSGGEGLWTQLNSAAAQVPVTAIMNPFNGPGNSLDGNYVTAVNSLNSAGGRSIGYVHTSYGSRPLEDVLADIDRYDNWYDVDGIFVDEMANTGPAERLNYYKSIYDHVKAIDPQWEVMGNPGTNTIEQYLTWPTADRLMVFEGFGSNYPGYTPSTWNFNHDSSRFVHLVHAESSENLEAVLNFAVARNAGGIYITNDELPNPWDTLPTYWNEEVAAVGQLNTSFLESDFDKNGAVDELDLTVWLAGYGIAEGAPHMFGDANQDGDVDGADFLTWQRQFGQSSLATLTASSDAVRVPEVILPWEVLIAMWATISKFPRRFRILNDLGQHGNFNEQ